MNQEQQSDKNKTTIIEEISAADSSQDSELNDAQLEDVAGGGKVGKFFDHCFVTTE